MRLTRDPALPSGQSRDTALTPSIIWEEVFPQRYNVPGREPRATRRLTPAQGNGCFGLALKAFGRLHGCGPCRCEAQRPPDAFRRVPPAEPRRPPAPCFAVTDGPLTRGVTSHLHAANPAPGAAVRASFSETRGGPRKFLARTLQVLDTARLYRQRQYFTPIRRLRWDGKAFRRLRRGREPAPVCSQPARLPLARGDPARTGGSVGRTRIGPAARGEPYR